MNLVDYSCVRISDGFWKRKQDMVKNTTVYTVYNRFIETHRFDALRCNWKEGDPNMPHIYWDSDIAKWIEGVAYILKFERNDELEKIVDDAIEEIIKNSDENGYFNSFYLVNPNEKPFTNRENHELYCAGHLIEAAVAYYNSTGKKAFLDAMCKYADYIEKVFIKEKSASFLTPGHPEIELALVRLYETTGKKNYLDLAKFFIDNRGNNDKDITGKWFNKIYYMDEKPLRNVEEPTGHAVRALYLLCGMADIAKNYNDQELLSACQKCYDSIVSKRMYITGGVGSTYQGEAFTLDYHLPNRTAYNETCAAISLCLFSNRMLKLENCSKYADTFERAMYNGVLAGISLKGNSFFYENPLEINTEINSLKYSTTYVAHNAITERVEVFDCSCCPPNLVRFISSIGNYIYGYDDNTVYINQFIDSKAEFCKTKISIKTNYPISGKILVEFETDKKRIAIRKPEWCENVLTNEKYVQDAGYLFFDTDYNALSIEFEMKINTVCANPRVRDNAGRIAITRGPIVYCAEAIDNGKVLYSVRINEKTFCVENIECEVPNVICDAYKPKASTKLYSSLRDDFEKCNFKLIPYYAFANRGESDMLVWLLYK